MWHSMTIVLRLVPRILRTIVIPNLVASRRQYDPRTHPRDINTTHVRQETVTVVTVSNVESRFAKQKKVNSLHVG